MSPLILITILVPSISRISAPSNIISVSGIFLKSTTIVRYLPSLKDSTEPVSTISPPRISETLWQTSCISGKTCEERKIVTPWLLSSFMISNNDCRTNGSRASVGSSIINNSGLCCIACTSPSFFAIPEE